MGQWEKGKKWKVESGEWGVGKNDECLMSNLQERIMIEEWRLGIVEVAAEVGGHWVFRHWVFGYFREGERRRSLRVESGGKMTNDECLISK